jgi:uracil-DNA glycosylase
VTASATARIMIVGQAPGNRVHLSGQPFTDPSGDRLRAWMGVDKAVFYDSSRVAIIPMGFCFPGNDAKGGDLPPRRECVATWHDRLMPLMPGADLILVIGRYAIDYHFARLGLSHFNRPTLTETVMVWREIFEASATPRILVLPHPSWRNTGWLKQNPWFDADLVPRLQAEVAARL